MKIAIINGPNLNLIGLREPEIYGNKSLDVYLEELKHIFPDIEFCFFQSNQEHALIDELHRVGFDYDGVVLNAGAYTHTSLAIGDAVSAIKAPVVEVHISNIFSREEIRHHSFISPVSAGLICGFGLDGYRLAILALLNKIN